MSSYSPIWQAKENELTTFAKNVKASYPNDWAATNNPSAPMPERQMYIRRVAWAARNVILVGPNGEQFKVGLNWKRGKVGDLSLDALALVNPTGAPDHTGGKPGLEIRDIIGSHGASNATIAFGDATPDTIEAGVGGGFIQPTDPDTTSLPDNGGGGTPVKPIKPRDQFAPEFSRVNNFYGSEPGLQRVGGMVAGVDASVFNVLRAVANGEIQDMTTIRNACQQVLGVQCDVQAMIQWGWDLANGATPEQCEAAIRSSDEWKAKHPNG